jgi:xylan 1,4-beta-xylosidase
MKRMFFLLITVLAMSALGSKNTVEEEPEQIFFADPTIYVDNGKYYLTGTGGGRPSGFKLLVSDDLRTWKVPGDDSICQILEAGKGSFGTRGFWAPQIFKEDGMYYLTHTANEQTVLTKSRSLMGPFLQDEIKPIDETEKNIDSFIFKDDDGKHYLYHVRFNKGNYLWAAEFDMKTGKLDPTTLTRCFGATKDWEATPNYESSPIMEGPTILKMKGTYYLLYSANHFRNIDYAVGYATSDSPFGPWKKHEESPFIHRSVTGENGSGHGDVFKGNDGNLYYVFHVHNSDSVISPRGTRIVQLNLDWNEDADIFDISIDANTIIKPVKVD